MIPELGQTKLDFTGQHRAKRPGKLSNPETRILLQRSIGSRHWISRESAHEASLARSFEDACIIRYDDGASDPEGHPLHWNFYSWELKLSAVQYALNTYVRGKKPDDPLKLILGYRAVAKLKITTTMLRSWIRNRIYIANQKKDGY